MDCVAAIEHLTMPTTDTRLSDVLVAVQDLVRQSMRPIGGMPLPDLSYDPKIYTPRPLAVATLATLLNGVAGRLGSQGASDGVSLEVLELGSIVTVVVSATALDGPGASEVSRHVMAHLGAYPSIEVDLVDDTIRIGFAIRPDEAID